MEYLTPEDIKIAEVNGIPEHIAKFRFYAREWEKERAITQKCNRPTGLWPKFKGICQENGVSKTTFFYRVRNYGMTPEEASGTQRLERGQGFKREYKLTPSVIKQAAENGIGKTTLSYRVYHLRWSVERAMTEPVKQSKSRKVGWK